MFVLEKKELVPLRVKRLARRIESIIEPDEESSAVAALPESHSPQLLDVVTRLAQVLDEQRSAPVPDIADDREELALLREQVAELRRKRSFVLSPTFDVRGVIEKIVIREM